VVGDLFDWEPPPPKPAPTGLELGHEAAEQAADHAGEEWKELAYAAFLAFAAKVGTFTTEDARESATDVPEPPDKRAWGQVALRAKRAGIIKSIGYANAKDRAVHGNVVTLWTLVPGIITE
jgi:hypothetical protein